MNKKDKMFNKKISKKCQVWNRERNSICFGVEYGKVHPYPNVLCSTNPASFLPHKTSVLLPCTD